MEANLRFPGPETMETKIFARLTAWQNWIFTRPNAAGPDGALRRYGTGQRAVFDKEASLTCRSTTPSASPTTSTWPRIGGCSGRWSPGSRLPALVGRDGPTLPTHDVYLRTAVAVGREGWANFARVKVPEYRWGIFLAERDRTGRSRSPAQGRAGLAAGPR